ncbi:sigma-70 family RNA polymerase sigma factor [Microbacterium sp. TWP3-1-2b2]|uniref:sigma-70 family RNA polymerase sigma factor n=1 Tax=Microbacterium sp. TWP3-1-2b2 TaxID=2804651 RepID=UPI003CF40139
MQNHDQTATGASADADLILRTRSGDADAYAELWRRHYPSGMSVARSITSSIDPDDLVQEAYTRIYQAIIKGGGPNGSFRAYLFTSIRNTAAAWGRSRRETAMDELDTVADPDSTEQAADEALDRSLTAQAFRGLPTRWQEVLWYTEIEQMKPAEVAPLLGMKSGAVSQLAFRAREGLREAWIQAHLRSAEPGSECQWAIEHLGAFSRGNLSARDQKRLDQHIEGCARCMIVVAEAKDVSNRLALVLLPLVLGIAGAAGYTATLQAGGAPIVALAAMPSSVVEGGIVVGGAGTSGTVGVLAGNGGGSGAAGGGSGAAGGGGAAGTTAAAGGSATGAMTGIGALVGAGSAALVVAGVVAATTIVPGLLEASPFTSMPSASEVGDSSISSELAPGTEMNDEKFILEIPEEDPKTPDDVDQTPEVKAPLNDDAPEVEAAPPAAPVAPASPAVPGDGSAGDGDEGTTEPVDPANPGTGPGSDPGADPGDGEQPVPGDGGDDGDQGGDDGDPPVPVLPDGLPEVGTAAVRVDPGTWVTYYTVPLTGVADATVRSTYSGSDSGTDTVLLADDFAALATEERPGSGTLELRPTLDQLCDDATVEFSYVLDDEIGEVVTIKLSELGKFPYPVLLQIACALNIDLASAAGMDQSETLSGDTSTDSETVPEPGALTADSTTADRTADSIASGPAEEMLPAETGQVTSEAAVDDLVAVNRAEEAPPLPAPTEAPAPAE